MAFSSPVRISSRYTIFQGVEDVSPTGSGVRNLPLIIAFSLATIVSGVPITKTGIATPILPVGSAIATVSAGLLYTLDIGTGSGKWVGYQIFAGFAYGIAFQVPIIVCQSTVDPSDLASVTAIMLCESRPMVIILLHPPSQADIIPHPQSFKLSAAHFFWQPRIPASSTRS